MNMRQITTQQHETLDDILYRAHGTSTAIAEIMALNPHALQQPRLPAGIIIALPEPQPKITPTLKLWD